MLIKCTSTLNSNSTYTAENFNWGSTTYYTPNNVVVRVYSNYIAVGCYIIKMIKDYSLTAPLSLMRWDGPVLSFVNAVPRPGIITIFRASTGIYRTYVNHMSTNKATPTSNTYMTQGVTATLNVDDELHLFWTCPVTIL